MCVPTRTEWPQHDFLDWLDATKRRLGLHRDAHLADHLGIGHTLISNWRSNKQRPSMETLNKIAAVLHEDPRRLWVLAGWTNAVDVGLLADDTATVEPPLPDEVEQLIQLLRDERLDDDDRRYFLRAVRGVCEGVLADLSRRGQAAQPRVPKQSQPSPSPDRHRVG